MLSASIKEVLKIKDFSSELSLKKIKEIHKIIKKPRKKKPCFNITTKKLSKKQVIVPVSNDNISNFMLFSSKYIANINRALKNIKSNVLANFA